MKHLFSLLFFLVVIFSSCKKTEVVNDNSLQSAIYVMSNEPDTNRILVFNREIDGSLNFASTVSSGGKGFGTRLGSGGGVSVSNNGKWLLAVNSGSNSVSSFRIDSKGMTLVSTVSSKGVKPVSITCHENLVAVANAGDNGNIVLFKLSAAGELSEIPGASKELGTTPTVPGQVSFTRDGMMLVASLKQTNKIVAYKVNTDGVLGTSYEINSNSPVPYGFAIGTNNQLYVTEAGENKVSVYGISSNGLTNLVAPFIPNQIGPCWATALANGNYFYVANAATNNVSGFKVNTNNSFTMLSDGVVAASGQRTIDIVSSADSKFVYTLNAESKSIRQYAVNPDGQLTIISDRYGLPSTVTAFAIN
jgi:6-phosphogluconolactonase